MKKFLQKTLALLALCLVSMGAWADNVVFTTADIPALQNGAESVTKSVVTISSPNHFYNYGSDFDLKGNYPFTVSVGTEYYLTSISISHGWGGMTTPTTGRVNGDTWTAADTNTSSVTLYTTGWTEFYNITVGYEIKAVEPVNYTVNFVGAPVGAEVTLDGETLSASNNTYSVAKTLDEDDLVVVDPAGFWTEVDFDGEDTFTVTYHAYNYYNVTVSGAVGGALVYDDVEYTSGQIEAKNVLTLGDVEAKKVAGYDADVTLEGSTFTVTYTAYPTVAIGANASDSEGNYWTSFSFKYPVSFADGVTPCIVTGADNGVLTIQEFEKVNNEVSTKYDFENNDVEAISGHLYCTGDNHDVTISYSGVSVYQSIGDKGYLQNEGRLSISCSTNPISKVIVKPWGWGVGANISLNSAAPVEVAAGDGTYEFDVNSNSCTLDITNFHGSVYILWIEVVTGGETVPVFPANTGILVKSDGAKGVSYTTHAVGEVNVDTSANLLQASGETGFQVSNDPNYLYYKLTLNAASDSGTAGFYWGVEGGHSISVPAHKAYLKLPVAVGSNYRALLFTEEGEVTGIEAVTSEDNAALYNLQGQRVNATAAGIYVKNGKKFIVK